MTETAAATLNNVDPTLRETLAVPYETERGTAYQAIDAHTGEALTPPAGIAVEIYDEWAAQEVAQELNALDGFLAGEQVSDESGETAQRSLSSVLEGLTNLSMLHIDQKRAEAIEAHAQANNDGGWRWEAGQISDKLAERQIGILSRMMPGNEPLSHQAFGAATPMLKSHALKPKAGHDEYRTVTGDNYLLKTHGEKAVKEKIDQLIVHRNSRRAEKSDDSIMHIGLLDQMGLHSQLVHFGEGPVGTTYRTTMYYPRAAVMDRTPIAMVGQDAEGSTGVAGVIHGGDEANHRRDSEAIRDRFARVHVDIAPEIQEALTPRHESRDVTFMAAADNAETAVNFEYPLEESVLFVTAGDLSRLITESVSQENPDELIPQTIQEICVNRHSSEFPVNAFNPDEFARIALDVKKGFDSGEEITFISPYAEKFWREVTADMQKTETEILASGNQLHPRDRKRIAQTALLHRVLKANSYSEEWAKNSTFISLNDHELGSYGEYATKKATEMIKKRGEGISYIQARAEKLQFDQLDLLTQLPVYKS